MIKAIVDLVIAFLDLIEAGALTLRRAVVNLGWGSPASSLPHSRSLLRRFLSDGVCTSSLPHCVELFQRERR